MNGDSEPSTFSSTLARTLEASYQHSSSALSANALQEKREFHLFGWPLHGTYASLIHNKIFSLRGISWNYSTLESQDPTDLLRELEKDDCVGEAVTMPYKLVFTKHVDYLTEEATAIGAVNTIFHQRTSDERKVRIGANSDVLGVRDSFIRNSRPEDLQTAATKPGLIVGCGGAARSSIYALCRFFGIKKFNIANRLRSEVDDVIAQFSRIPDYFWKRGVVLEMCYHPKVRTALFELCEAAGWNVVPSTEASMWQAFAQQVLWTEHADVEEAWVEEIRAVILKAIEGQGKT